MRLQHILPLSLIIILASCSSAYRIGQTPDDVYYSPAPAQQEEYVATNNQQDKDSYAYNNEQNMEDLSIRRGINNPMYRSGLSFSMGNGYSPYNNYGSSLYNPYYYDQGYSGISFYPGYNNSFYSPFYNSFNTPYYNSFNTPYYGSFYSPYSYNPVYYNTGGTKSYSSTYYSSPRQYNMGVYRSSTPRITTNNSAPVRTFTRQQPANTGVGGFIRRVFTPEQSAPANSGRTYNNNDNNYTPPRQMNTAPSGNGSSSSGGSGSAPVRTFRH